MQAITNDQMAILVKLQSIEIEVNRTRLKLGDVEEKLASLDAEIRTFERGIEDSDSRVGALKKQYRAFESDVDLNLSRIKKSEAKLRSVKTNKEYQSILKEIEDVRLVNSQIEDKMIEFLDEIEIAENYRVQKQADYDELKIQIGDQKETIQHESEAGRARLADLEKEWKEISAKVDPALMKIYKTVKENRHTAVAAVENATCQGCHLNIPPQMYNELHRCTSLTFCPHCQRIVYLKNSVE